MSRDIGGFMRLTAPFTTLRNATSDIWRMHDFNYQLPKDKDKSIEKRMHRPSNMFSLQSLLKAI